MGAVAHKYKWKLLQNAKCYFSSNICPHSASSWMIDNKFWNIYCSAKWKPDSHLYGVQKLKKEILWT